MLGNSGAALGDAAVERIPEGLSSQDWGHLRTLVEEASYEVELVGAREDGARADSFQAGNVRHKMRIAFEREGVRVTPAKGEASWELGLRLKGYGYEGALQTPPVATLQAAGNRMEYRCGDLVEWYVNDGRGLEQGFTLRQRPGASRGRRLRVEMELSGTLAARWAEGSDSAAFVDAAGKTLLSYGGLVAWDAEGAHLPAALEVDGDVIALVVDDAEAHYPLTIDPTIVNENAKLTAGDASEFDNFGWSVFISGDTVVVGARFDDCAAGLVCGAAYVFERPLAGGWVGATETAKLTASDAANGDHFGFSVSISEDTVVAGAHGADCAAGFPRDECGVAYVFEKPPAGGWVGATETAKLTASDAAVGDWFGRSVSISGDTIVAGAPRNIFAAGPVHGAAYLFEKPLTGGWVSATETAKLTARDAAVGDWFGRSVSISGDTVVVGAPRNTFAASPVHGAAYVFEKPTAGGWVSATESATLTASDAAELDEFGWFVSISGETVVASAHRTDCAAGFDCGAAYVFDPLAPTADAGLDQTVECAAPSGTVVSLSGSGSSDPDDDTLTFTWTGPFSEGGGTVMGSVQLVTLPVGVHIITLTVDDGHEHSDSDQVEVTVEDTTPPTVMLTSTSLGITIPSDGTGAAVDVLLESGALATDLCDDDVDITFSPAGPYPPGATAVTITATDEAGLTDDAIFTVNVNRAPIADAGPDQEVSTGDSDRVKVALDGSASSDPDGDPLRFTWTGSFGTLKGVVVNPVLRAGTHNITLTTADGKGGRDTDVVQISISDGRPPNIIVSVGSLTFMLDETSAPSTGSARLLPVRPVDAETASKPFTLTVERGPVSFRILPGGSWLRTEPSSGRLVDGVVQRIQAIVDPTGLPAGTHTAPLLIRAGARIAARLDVTLVITPSGGPPPVSPPMPEVLENGVVNAANLIPFGQPGHAMAAGSMASIFGSNFSDDEHFEAETIPLPLELGGVSVTLNGIPAPLFGVWPDQINIQLPWELLESLQGPNASPARPQQGIPTATLVVVNAAGSSAPREIQLDAFSPAIFTAEVSGSGQGAVTFANSAVLAGPLGFTANSRPAKEGDLLTIYANGLGPVEPRIADGLNSCDPDGQCLPDFSNVVLRHTATQPAVTIGGAAVPEEDVLFSGLRRAQCDHHPSPSRRSAGRRRANCHPHG